MVEEGDYKNLLAQNNISHSLITVETIEQSSDRHRKPKKVSMDLSTGVIWNSNSALISSFRRSSHSQLID